MKLLDLLAEARPLTARGNINAPAYAKYAGTAPTQRLTKKQQQVKAQQPVNPRQPQQQQQPQQQPQQQQPQEPQPQQASPAEAQNKEAIKRAAGVEEITSQNILDVLPKLVSKFKSDTNFVKQIVNVVATSVSSGQEFAQSAQSMQQHNKEARQQGIKPVSSAGNPDIKAKKLYNDATSLPKDNRKQLIQALQQSLGEAVAAPATNAAPVPAAPTTPPKINTPQVQQLLLAQIKAAVKGTTPQVRQVLKARVQQAMLLPQGATPDPNKLMQHGQPVIKKAGIQRTPGPGVVNTAKAGLKKFLGMK